MRKIIFIFLSVLTIAGCRMDTNVELYLGDVLDVARQNGSPLTSTGSLSIHVISSDECEKNKFEIIKIVSKYIDNVVDQGCIERDMNDFLELSVDYAISTQNEGSLIQLLVSSDENSYSVDYVMNRGKFDSLNAEVARIFSTDIEIDKSFISLTVINDQKRIYVINISSAFVDGKPVIMGYTSLKKRGSVDMVFSDVHSSKLSSSNRVNLVSIEK
jgi:hypothetical protein